MSDIRTRPSVDKKCGNQTQSIVEIRERTQFHTSQNCQRIVSIRKNSKNIEESGVAYVRKVKHRSQSYSPVKERKNMITQNFNTGRLVTTKKKKTPSACYHGGKVHWAKDCPYRTKNVKTTINSDIRAHSVETEK